MFLSKYCKNSVLGFLIGVFVLKRNGIAPPTPIDQVSAQSDEVYYVFVHSESESVKTTILIAKVTLPECQIIVIFEFLSKC
jgi:hypothetical protein